ncbi:MAG TPA: AIR synthase-related protein, partial [Armatimonadota bacterium]|nr:AIR synthase-related protein [Armatimonadota bacterium]
EVVQRHIRPIPRVAEARAATENNLVCAMMDLSDGLAIDLGKMCKASSVGARIYTEKLPVSGALKQAAEALGENAAVLAASGGEDYELLIAANPEDAERLADIVHQATGTMVTEIGEFTEGSETVIVSLDGEEKPLEPGWIHF